MQQRTDLELGRNAVVFDVRADEEIGSSEHCHFGVPHIISLTARHDEPKGLERALSQQLTERLKSHDLILRVRSRPVDNMSHHYRG
jgi:hypothetical protein